MKHSGSILKNPRITEKASMLAEGNAYTFNVAIDATKKEIAHAVKMLYKVTPLRVRTLAIPKTSTSPRGARGKVGTTGGGKKAYVYLKKGDKIEVL
jgi:large subunit ribosomal protein L23